ncbi:MAG: isoprenyl transferase [Candidatus Saelkia tenebricola]|nr:isoprenyl transferase [Candidatus Saelkia tenebricola]
MSIIPRHIAVIMDGNGRWAKNRKLPRGIGHRQGVKSAQRIIKSCVDLGVRYLTLYAFSTENWKRPPREIKIIMNLFLKYITASKTELPEHEKVRVRVIGRWHELPYGLPSKIQSIIDDTAKHEGLNLTLAINYGGRKEILDAIGAIIKDSKTINTKNVISEEFLQKYLYAPEIPDPDLLIRTAGEYRISNFLLWQMAYAEIYVTKKLWPDFGKSDLMEAMNDFQNRERRFGSV